MRAERLTPAMPGSAEATSRPRFSRPEPPRVVVVGGGLAGLAAAVGLAERGVRLTVLESRPRLGGRAGSFHDPSVGGLVDNCQHVSMGCCTNLAHFCERVGTRHLFRPLKSIRFLATDAPPSIWAESRLPAPLHLVPAFLKSRFLTLGDKLRIARGMSALRRAKPGAAGPFSEWLRAHGQTPRVIERFWATVLVSALNERLDRLDVGYARQVFVDGFLRNRMGHRVEIPAAPLGAIYGEPLETWLGARGAELSLNAGVTRIDIDAEGAVRGVRLRDGSTAEADFVIAAVPFHRLADLFEPADRDRLPVLASLEQMQSTPITGIHLWFDRRVCPVDHAAFIDRTLHWVFDHTGESRENDGGQYLQCVVSASYELAEMENAEVVDRALADLAVFWPDARREHLTRWRVVTEHRATFSARPGIDVLRPPQRTPIEGLFLAGDWTSTGWPATMEGAVRSGYLAAEGVLADLGRPTRLVQPDLPTDRLAAWFLGRSRALKPALRHESVA